MRGEDNLKHLAILGCRAELARKESVLVVHHGGWSRTRALHAPFTIQTLVGQIRRGRGRREQCFRAEYAILFALSRDV